MNIQVSTPDLSESTDLPRLSSGYSSETPQEQEHSTMTQNKLRLGSNETAFKSSKYQESGVKQMLITHPNNHLSSQMKPANNTGESWNSKRKEVCRSEGKRRKRED